MKNLTFSIITVLALSSFAVAGGNIEPVAQQPASPIIEKGNSYVGLGYSYMRFEFDEIYNSWDYASGNGYTLLAGYTFNKYIALEGRYTSTIGDLTTKYANGSPDNDFNGKMTNLALYLKPMYPFEWFTLYGLVGYGKLTYEQTGSKYSESGLQWGVGASKGITENIDVFIDYTRLYDDKGFDTAVPLEDISSYSINIGITYKF